jgi:hypothetical protein
VQRQGNRFGKSSRRSGISSETTDSQQPSGKQRASSTTCRTNSRRGSKSRSQRATSRRSRSRTTTKESRNDVDMGPIMI